MEEKSLGNRGIRIPLKRDSWELIAEVLLWVADHPETCHEFEDRQEECIRVAKYIKSKLERR
jgi:hypothetical protein